MLGGLLQVQRHDFSAGFCSLHLLNFSIVRHLEHRLAEMLVNLLLAGHG